MKRPEDEEFTEKELEDLADDLDKEHEKEDEDESE